jgi:hypothetical protein
MFIGTWMRLGCDDLGHFVHGPWQPCAKQKDLNMKNVPLLDHFAITNSKYQVSWEIAAEFVRSYYAEMFSADEAASNVDTLTLGKSGTDIFERTMSVFSKYWQCPTPYSDYWTPGLSWPSDYAVTNKTKFDVKQDMQGNFVVSVSGAGNEYSGEKAYLLCVIDQSLRIVNKFF